jgi:hypothetical protein
MDEGLDTGAVYASVGVSFVPAVPAHTYIRRWRPDHRWEEPPPELPPFRIPTPDPGRQDARRPEDPAPGHNHPGAPGVAPAPEDRPPWEIIATLAATAILALVEANRRTVRVGLRAREEPED